MEPDRRPHVVIVGAGFAGLEAAKILGGRDDVRVTVVDRRNHHLFQPLVYQVATAALDPSDVAAPIRGILRKARNTEVVLAEVSSIDRVGRTLRFADGGSVDYDHLIVASGTQDNYFGHSSWADHAPGMKSIEGALEARRRLLFAFEEAEREQDEGRRRAWLTFVIIGGGPTGVELAGSLSEMAHRALPRDFRHIDTTSARIVLVEGLDRLLPAYSEHLSARAKQVLERLQVQVRLGTRVTAIDEQGVMLGAERIDARTVLWGAGVAPSPLGKMLGAPVNRAGQVEVAPDLTLPGDSRVAVVGDLAAVIQDGQLLPGIAPPAMQMGRAAARNVVRRVQGKVAEPFRYFDKGSFAVIGRGSAVGSIFSKFEVSGLFAWVMWATIHLFYLVSFRSRFTVLFTWLYSYLTWGRIARLITFSPWIRRWEEAPGRQPSGAPASAAPAPVVSTPVPVQAAPDR